DGGAAAEGVVDEAVAVDVVAAHGDVGRARGDQARVGGHGGHGDVRGAGDGGDVGNGGEQGGQRARRHGAPPGVAAPGRGGGGSDGGAAGEPLRDRADSGASGVRGWKTTV